MAGELFSFAPRAGDRLLDSFGAIERIFSSLVQRWRRHEPLFRSGDLEQILGTLGRRAVPPPKARSTENNRPILVLPAVAWNYRFQRPQQLALALARRGHPVLYIEGFLRTRFQAPRRLFGAGDGVQGLRVRIPGRPDPYREALPPNVASSLAALIASGFHRAPVMILAQLPFWGPVARELRDRLGAPLIYDRIDLHTDFPRVPAAMAAVENDLVQCADLVTATSTELLSLSPTRTAAVLLPNAAAIADFPFAAKRPPAPPRIGYVGALGDWVDAEAIASVARAEPRWQFPLAGRVESDAIRSLAALPNIQLLGELPYQAVPQFLSSLHVALIPFMDNRLTRAVDPVKLYEALAVGLPVVGRDLPELRRWPEPYVYTYQQSATLPSAIATALAADTIAVAGERRVLVEAETWDHRAATLLSAVAEIRRDEGRL